MITCYKMTTFANPKVWGSSAWVFLHCISRTFPETPNIQDRNNYILFFRSLAEVLPCKLCRNHYREWLQLYPIEKYVANRDSLKNWVFLMHNYVNLRQRKKLIKDCDSGDIIILNHAKKNKIF